MRTHDESRGRRAILGGLAVLAALTVACGSSGAPTGTGVRVVSPDAAAEVQADPPPGLQIIDVRTPEEYAGGHLEGAEMIDFYGDHFVDRIAALDRDQPYLIYCQSGNRSGQTRELMEELGFTDVQDLDGGIVAWSEADLTIVR